MVFVALSEYFKGSALYFKGSGDDIVFAVIFFAPIVVIVLLIFRHNRSTYRERLREWERRYVCQDCGVVFVP